MPRSAVTIDEQDLERALLRKSVGALSDDRDDCADCRRTPLVGETLYRYASGAAVCELCRPRHRAAPDSSALVRSPGHEHVVRTAR